MLEYIYERIEEELFKLETIYKKLYSRWNKLEDHEVLYKIRIPLLVLGTLVRTISGKKIQVKILKDIEEQHDPRNLKFNEKERLSLLESDTFKNKIETPKSMKDICDYLVHDLSSGYSDTRKSFDDTGDFKIYYCVSTDRKPEIMIDIQEFIDEIKRLLENKK
jgi:hypothetical protein